MQNLTRAVALAAFATIAAGTATGTAVAAPELPAATAPGVPGPAPADAPAGPVDPTTAYLGAIDALGMAWSSNSLMGQVVGTAAGLAVGCPLGALTGGTLTMVMPVLTPVGIVGGCILGAGAMGFLGGIAGSLITGGPALADAFGQQYGSLRANGLIAAESPAEVAAG
ncbi:hypothetical protein ACWDYH_28220 [Nocardia goodfellowii]